jgi:hypothetical protein
MFRAFTDLFIQGSKDFELDLVNDSFTVYVAWTLFGMLIRKKSFTTQVERGPSGMVSTWSIYEGLQTIRERSGGRISDVDVKSIIDAIDQVSRKSDDR